MFVQDGKLHQAIYKLYAVSRVFQHRNEKEERFRFFFFFGKEQGDKFLTLLSIMSSRKQSNCTLFTR